ncbi:hypothetical protein [Hymenobacter jejuensis]|uniref:Uncharacterized protein n=1 Tax=Hymenobacter jejuensis TaxID=2502781 RepID=A0A5B8A1L2_9BACT|nr:hypothetical protein [Hymenobacter jejuensis]QDA61007.1 hypothetical protein FHG12_13230 [Hymenobacter jejuensis]
MRIDEIDQEDADIDWFATDSNGCILHVASGGGILPESVATSQEALLELHQYFLTLPEADSPVVTEAEARADEGSYQGFARYARRGLFSFTKTRLHDRADTRYYLVARPQRPLTVAELPKDIATLLRRTQLPSSVAQQNAFDAATIL